MKRPIDCTDDDAGCRMTASFLIFATFFTYSICYSFEIVIKLKHFSLFFTLSFNCLNKNDLHRLM